MKGFGIEQMQEAIIAAGAILHYLKDTEHPNLQHITRIQRIDRDDYLWMDKFTDPNHMAFLDCHRRLLVDFLQDLVVDVGAII